MESEYEIPLRPRYSNIKLCSYILFFISYLVATSVILSNKPLEFAQFWYYCILLSIYTGTVILTSPLAFIYDWAKRYLVFTIFISSLIWISLLFVFNDRIIDYYVFNYKAIFGLVLFNIVILIFSSVYIFMGGLTREYSYRTIEV